MKIKEKGTLEKNICEAIAEPMLVMDAEGTIVMHNQAFREMVGGDCSGADIKSMEGMLEIWDLFQWYIKRGKEEQRRNRFSFHDRYYEVTFNDFNYTEKTLYSVVFHDISHFLSIEQELLKRNKELMAINTLSSAFIIAKDMGAVLNKMMETVMMITDFSLGWLVILDKEEQKIVSMKGVPEGLKRAIEDGCIAEFINSISNEDEPLYIFDRNDIQLIPCLKKEGIVFFGVIPLRVYNSLSGFLCLGNRIERTFDFDIASMMSLVGNQVSLILEKVKLFEETKRLSITDALTGLYNARYFYQSLDKELERAKRYNERFALIIFDIDDFKEVNDNYGHQAGDEILKEFSKILLQHTRKTDIVARYGGEEFVIVLPNTHKDVAYSLAERIMKQVCETVFKCDGDILHITVSGGIAGFPDDGSNSKDLLYCADMALYEAKKRGKKRVIQYRGDSR